MALLQRDRYERSLLVFARAITVGAAYVAALPVSGLGPSFVAIFTSLLSFDIIVASSRPPIGLQDWKQLIDVIRPRILSTASALLKGVGVGAAVGLLAILGLPSVLGAVLTSGLAYVWALNTPYLITTYVAILSGLALFERLASLEAVATMVIVREVVAVVAAAGAGTFYALLAGWTAGLITGSVARLLLSRPYRSLRSAAYELPLERRPFAEVLHVGEQGVLVSVKVEEGAPLAGKSLAESRLREHWNTTVLMIRRGSEEWVMPMGSVVVRAGDELLMLTEKDRVSQLYGQVKGPQEACAKGQGGSH